MARYDEATKAAIKNSVDIVSLLADYGLPAHRSGTKLKVLCPFHDDHNPSLELNPERQSYKCWSCGAGGDIFTFVQEFERVDFPEALRMLADRAGITLEQPTAGSEPVGPSKTDLFAANAWAESEFVAGLGLTDEARAYLDQRGINKEMTRQFRLGFAPEARDWLVSRARRAGFSLDILELAGLVSRAPENPQMVRERFRGRLIFPIHDARGRTVAFGGRVMPELEQRMAEAGKGIAKYLNSPETRLFKKSRNLYGIDHARVAARNAGWVGVVEGYTDVIAAHQVGLANFVGTLGTALTDDHVRSLRSLADRVVLVFDGDEAGQKAADRSLELFLGHEVDVRVLTLPEHLDPCDFLLENGSAPFEEMVGRAVDPLTFAITRAASMFDLDSAEGSRQVSERVLSILSRIPTTTRAGLDVKVAKAIDTLAQRIRVPVALLNRRLKELTVQSRRQTVDLSDKTPKSKPILASSLDPVDLELIRILLNHPAVVSQLITRVTVASLRDQPLQAILQVCYDLHTEGEVPSLLMVLGRLDDPSLRDLTAELKDEPCQVPVDAKPFGWRRMDPREPNDIRLKKALWTYQLRETDSRIRDLREALKEVDPVAKPEEYRALRVELQRSYQLRPDTKRLSAS